MSSIVRSGLLLLSSSFLFHFNEPIHFMKKCIMFHRDGYRYEIDYVEIDYIAFSADLISFCAGGVHYEIAIKPLKGDEIQEILKRFEYRKQKQKSAVRSSRRNIPFQYVFKTAFEGAKEGAISDKTLEMGCLLFFIGLPI